MIMDKILTIVVPTYNMEKYLDKCLTSLILPEELMPCLEVLVINDGSKDGSSEIAHGYERKYPQTYRVIDKNNGNYGSCVNCGLKEAQGKYIKILDADDTFDDKNFSLFVSFLKTVNVDCVISDMIQVNDVDSVFSEWKYDLPRGETFTLSDLGDYTVKNMWMHCVCYNTENVRRIGYHQTEGISYTDQEWICLPMSAAKSLVYFPYVVYHYLVGREGQTVNPDVWEKNFWMEIQGVKVMMKSRIKLYPDCTSEGEEYIDARIRIRLETIYSVFFLVFVSMKNMCEMAKLDEEIRKYNQCLWKDLGHMVFAWYFPWHFVREWRQGYDLHKVRGKIERLSSIRMFVKKVLCK